MAEGKSHSDVREADNTKLMRGSNVEEGSWETIHLCCAAHLCVLVFTFFFVAPLT